MQQSINAFNQRFIAQRQAASSGAEIAWLPDDPIGWIQTEFFIPETKDDPDDPYRLRLESYQQSILRRAFPPNHDNFPYSLILWSDLKKSAKSVIAAGVVLWLAWHHPWEMCRVVGNDLKQAHSRTFFYITRAIELNPRLKAVCKVKQYHIELPNHTQIEAVAVDPKGEAGGGDLIVCFTELWAAKNEAAQQLWTETTLSPLKYGKSLRFCESYAGFIGASPILEQLYEQGVKQGRQVDVGIEGLELYENEAARMLCLWNTTPRCRWQTSEYYAQEAAVLTESEYQRIHANQWAQSTSTFVPIEWWRACRDEVPLLGPYEPVVVAIDAAVTSDCFAIVMVSRVGEQCFVRYVRVWYPPKGGKIDFSEPEAELRRLGREYSVVEFAYDPHQLEDMAMRLSKDGVGYFAAFSQMGDRLVADKMLYDCILHRRITHSGDSDLDAHIQNADQSQDKESLKLRIVKRQPELKIDACVTLSMANYRARFLNIG